MPSESGVDKGLIDKGLIDKGRCEDDADEMKEGRLPAVTQDNGRFEAALRPAADDNGLLHRLLTSSNRHSEV